jgi:hypothetical protein
MGERPSPCFRLATANNMADIMNTSRVEGFLVGDEGASFSQVITPRRTRLSMQRNRRLRRGVRQKAPCDISFASVLVDR